MDNSYAKYDNDRLMACIGLSILVFCLSAFALKAILEPARLARYNPMVMIHAVLMVGWLSLFTVQSWLMSDGAFARHYFFGRLSIILVVLMISSSTLIAIQYTYDFQSTHLLSVNSIAWLRFAVLYGAAVICIFMEYTGLHRRLMLLATTVLISPAVGRFADAVNLPERIEIFSGVVASIVFPVIFDLGSGGLRRSTLLLILGAVLLEIAGLAFALGYLQGALASLMLDA